MKYAPILGQNNPLKIMKIRMKK